MTLKVLRQIYSTGLLLTILAFLATGCGDSENFVFTGTNVTPPAATTGDLTFNFFTTLKTNTLPKIIFINPT